MQRRDLIRLFDASAAPGPLAARAQLPVMRVIDTSILVHQAGANLLPAFRKGLSGYAQGAT